MNDTLPPAGPSEGTRPAREPRAPATVERLDEDVARTSTAPSSGTQDDWVDAVRDSLRNDVAATPRPRSRRLP